MEGVDDDNDSGEFGSPMSDGDGSSDYSDIEAQLDDMGEVSYYLIPSYYIGAITWEYLGRDAQTAQRMHTGRCWADLALYCPAL